ncbi:GNAT family N-acetyltransferase [Rossellomorea sp. NS-SX7]|uniref:GNAT family N-acetyltransferase n=1 Tax=Rossellomorea sp. NS-SX7 TaxID=3463856 RepID=UPI0040594FCD
MEIAIEKASLDDAPLLTEIMKTTFDEEAVRWLDNGKYTVDYNVQPPGYASVEKNKYMIRELEVYKIFVEKQIAGGIIVTISGTSYGRIDRIFIHPDFQGKGIGTSVIELIETEFPQVKIWNLETSARQKNNHFFYEKVGYRTVYESEEEYCYEKKIEKNVEKKNLVKEKDISGRLYEHCDLSHSEFYGVRSEESSFSNSNLMGSHVSNCNVSRAKFQNINFTHSLFADLNLSNSQFAHVTLSDVHFRNTDLGEEKDSLSFEGCDLQGTRFSNCNLKGVTIEDCDLSEVMINHIPVKELLDAYKRLHNT